MIDRIGTAAHSSALLTEFQRLSTRAAETQGQISSGKVGQHYSDVADKAGVLSAAKIRSARTDALISSTRELDAQMQQQELYLRQLDDMASELRLALGDAVSTGRGDGLMARVEAVFQSALGVLNAKVNGNYVFGGTRTDLEPVAIDSVADLAAAPSAASIFQNAPSVQRHAIDESVTIETGHLASDLGTDLFQVIRDIAIFEGGANGPFGSNLTAAQTSFLTTQFAAAPAAAGGIHLALAENGIRHRQIEEAREGLDASSAYLKKFIGEIEDTDMAKAITQLNQDQAALQAAARMLATLPETSLLNVLR